MWGNGIAGAMSMEEMGATGRVHVSDATVAGLHTEHFVIEEAHHLSAAQASELGIARSYYVHAAPPPIPSPAAEQQVEVSPDARRRSSRPDVQQPITLRTVKHSLQSLRTSLTCTASDMRNSVLESLGGEPRLPSGGRSPRRLSDILGPARLASLPAGGDASNMTRTTRLSSLLRSWRSSSSSSHPPRGSDASSHPPRGSDASSVASLELTESSIASLESSVASISEISLTAPAAARRSNLSPVSETSFPATVATHRPGFGPAAPAAATAASAARRARLVTSGCRWLRRASAVSNARYNGASGWPALGLG